MTTHLHYAARKFGTENRKSNRRKLMSKLERKVAVVTGGNGGIGLATAQRFVAEGAYVFITGRRQNELYAAVKLIGKNLTAVQGVATKVYSLIRLLPCALGASRRQSCPHLQTTTVFFCSSGIFLSHFDFGLKSQLL
jgi:NAD(P)-dependent dehydrogenase (short-subunit alcohol dehydrogenase family)